MLSLSKHLLAVFCHPERKRRIYGIAQQQKMVMEAAKLAMPNTKVVDEDGNPKVVYHQTNSTVYINRETGQNWDELDWRERMELASTIMTRQHTYGRPPFDYAFTDGSFYVYDYLGDGDSIINFAMPIVGNEDLIQNITNSIDNGTITDTRGLDLYAENLQGKQRVNYRRFADAFKKRHGNRGYGVTFRGDSASNGGTYFEDSKRIGGDATTRGTSGNIDESANHELTTRFSLITPEMDASYLDAVERGDMATASNPAHTERFFTSFRMT